MPMYFENIKTKKRFKVVKLDKEKGIVTLQGDHNPFVEPYSRERFEKLGYRLVVEQAV